MNSTLFCIAFILMPFVGLGQATHLGYLNSPQVGNANANLAKFGVQALTVNGAVDSSYTGLITLTKSTGPGNLQGMDTATAIFGTAYFSHVYFDAAGTYTLGASATNLTAVTSGSILIGAPAVYGKPGKLIYFWDFNQTQPLNGWGTNPTNGNPADTLGTATLPLLPNYTSSGSTSQIRYYIPQGVQGAATTTNVGACNATAGSKYYEYNSNKFNYFSYPGDSLTAGGNMALKVANPCLNDYMYFYMPSTGYQNLHFNFAVTGSDKYMANYIIFSYSPDGGNTWNNLTSAMDTFLIGKVHRADTLQVLNPKTIKGTWYPINMDFSTGNLFNDNPNFILRFKMAGPNAQGAAGFTRFDNFALTGDSVCPTFNTALSNTYGCPNASVNITASVNGGVNNVYQWQENSGNGFVNLSNSTLYAGVNTNKLTLNGITSNMNGYLYRVIVTSGLCGTITSNADTLKLYPSPNVVANASATSICKGGQVTLFGSGANTYVWSNSVYDNLPNNFVSTGTYTVTGTDGNGCKNTSSVTVTIFTNPTVAIQTPSTKVCFGTPVVLHGQGAKTYTWTPGGVADSLTLNLGLGTTAYTVVAKDSNGCTGTANTTITVDTLPQVYANASNASICAGNKVAVFATGNALNYTWSGGVKNDIPFVMTPGTITYTVTGTAINTCHATSTVTITGYAQPQVKATASQMFICTGDSLKLTGNGAKTYQWTGGVMDNNYFKPTVAKTYTVTGIDSNNCANTATVFIPFYAKPIVTANASTNELCQGNTVIVYGTGATTYTWNQGVQDSVAFKPQQTATYYVTGTDANGCKNTDSTKIVVDLTPQPKVAGTQTICAGKTIPIGGTGITNVSYNWTPVQGLSCSNCANPNAGSANTYTLTSTDATTGCIVTATVLVNVNPAPKVTIVSSADSICMGDNLQLSGQGALKYVWTSGVINNVPFAPSNTVTYTVTGTDNKGCTASASKTVNVNPLPQVTAFSTGYAVCTGMTVKLIGGGALNYNWSPYAVNDSSTVITSPQTYTVTGTDTHGCSNTATVQITLQTCTGIDNAAATSDNISLYPNPAIGYFTINLGEKQLQANISLLTADGRLIQSIQTNGSFNRINTLGLNAGVYLVKITSTQFDAPVIKKIILQNE